MTSSTRLPVPVDGATLIGERWGGGAPTTVFLHAGVCDRRSWYGVVAALGRGEPAAGEDPVGTMVAYDRRGFGETAPPAAPFSHLDDLGAVLDHCGPEPVWLVGSSMGGALALDCALAHPERVGGLVLLAPAVSGVPESVFAGIDDPAAERLETLAEAAAAREDLAEAGRLEAWLWLDGPSSPEGRVGGEARELALAMNAVALAGASEFDGQSGVAAWDRLGELAVPVTVAYGDLDERFAAVMAAALVDRVAGAHLVELRGRAHLPYLEDPDEVATLVAGARRGR